ncbi:hypothetical protein [Rhodococcus jostii]|uniref:hypothetical protein n=1 Tax=Rhodococcus jostii TaxID=132919 RepID=UPI00362E8F03
MERRRWDTDEHFTGLASGRSFAPNVGRLVAHLEREGWVTEDPDAHLLPHLQGFCEQPDSRWRLIGARLLDDGVYAVDIGPSAEMATPNLPIRETIPLLGQVAEASFAVQQIDENTIECVTGMLDGDGPYATHGHLIRLHIHR